MSAIGPIVACALGVAGLLVAEYRSSRAGKWLAKPIASAAFVWLGLASGASSTPYGRLVLLGLLFCMLGDLLLIPRGKPAVFRAGIFAFLAGHVAYSVAFLTQPLAAAGLVPGGLLLAAFIWAVLRWLGSSLPADMVAAVTAYMLVIGAMSALACGVTAAGGPAAVAAGALMFTASDVFVARNRFTKLDFANRALGLPLYYGGQLLLASTPALVGG
jgi:uncharacterized membrane protein YhhN